MKTILASLSIAALLVATSMTTVEAKPSSTNWINKKTKKNAKAPKPFVQEGYFFTCSPYGDCVNATAHK